MIEYLKLQKAIFTMKWTEAVKRLVLKESAYMI